MLGSPGIAATLNQNIKNEAVLVDGAPKPVLLTGNGDDDLIEVPFVAEFSGRAPTDVVCEVPAEFLCPDPHALVRDDNAAHGQHILDHLQAKPKA